MPSLLPFCSTRLTGFGMAWLVPGHAVTRIFELVQVLLAYFLVAQTFFLSKYILEDLHSQADTWLVRLGDGVEISIHFQQPGCFACLSARVAV